MLSDLVVNDQLVVEAKGIYSIEKFLIARRLMYWQVYLHKTVISAEQLLVNILKRAKELAGRNVELPGTEPLKYFLYNKIFKKDLVCNEDEMINVMEYFAKLDDYDIITSIKTWSDNSDRTLSILCQYLLNRKLYKVKIQNNPFDIDEINAYHKKTQEFLDRKSVV